MPQRSRKSAARGNGADPLAGALDSIRRLVQALRIASRVAEHQLGVSGAQLFVLHALERSPASSLNDLAARTYTHQSSVSVVVERLVRRKLVTRTRSAEDARRVVLTLTPAGRALLRATPEGPAQVRLIEALRQLPARDCHALARILSRVVQELGGAASGAAPMLFEDVTGRRGRASRRA